MAACSLVELAVAPRRSALRWPEVIGHVRYIRKEALAEYLARTRFKYVHVERPVGLRRRKLRALLWRSPIAGVAASAATPLINTLCP